jgi:hypothetical protein
MYQAYQPPPLPYGPGGAYPGGQPTPAPIGHRLPDFVGAPAQIGAGIDGKETLAWRGTVVVGHGGLSLLGDDGQVIDWAPLANVKLDRDRWMAGQAVWVRVFGRRYFVSVSQGPSPDQADGYARIAGTQGFITAYQRLTGRSV